MRAVRYVGECKTTMLEQLAAIEARFEELTRLMANPKIATNYEKVAEYAKERSDIEETVKTYRRYKDTETELRETEEMLQEDNDAELRELAEEEIARLESELASLEDTLQ